MAGAPLINGSDARALPAGVQAHVGLGKRQVDAIGQQFQLLLSRLIPQAAQTITELCQFGHACSAVVGSVTMSLPQAPPPRVRTVSRPFRSRSGFSRRAQDRRDATALSHDARMLHRPPFISPSSGYSLTSFAVAKASPKLRIRMSPIGVGLLGQCGW